jgi:hypothetical protein
MTSFNLKNIKIFSTTEEKESQELEQMHRDADFSNPHSELAMMHNATKWGVNFFAAVTLLSTAALIYRVTYPHMVELLGTSIATISMLCLAFGCAFAIEKMLRGNWEPFFKKAFIKGEIDVVLGSLGVVFTSIILYGALTGMEIISEEGKKDPQIESISASASAISATIEANKSEIATLSAGKGKGVYAWQGKPNSMTSLSKTTEAANAAKIETFTTKQAKAVKYLSILAIGAEILKMIIFIFWGYRSMQLNAFIPQPSTPPGTLPQPQPKPETPKSEKEQQHSLAKMAIFQLNKRLQTAMEMNNSAEIALCKSHLQMYADLGYNIVTGDFLAAAATPVKKQIAAPLPHIAPQAKKQSDNPAGTAYKDFTAEEKDTSSLDEKWNDNENRLLEACEELGVVYPPLKQVITAQVL